MVRKLCAAAIAALVVFLIAPCGQSFGQGLSGLSNLLGGGPKHKGSSGQSSPAVTVQRGASPYLGQFVGKRTQKSPSGQHAQTGQYSQTGESPPTSSQTPPVTNLTAQFACYPARDSALPQTKAFLCYCVE